MLPVYEIRENKIDGKEDMEVFKYIKQTHASYTSHHTRIIMIQTIVCSLCNKTCMPLSKAWCHLTFKMLENLK